MKQRVRLLTRICILFLVIIITHTNCEKNEALQETLTEEQVKSLDSYTIEIVPYSSDDQVLNALKGIYGIDNHMGLRTRGNFQRKSSATKKGIVVFTDIVKKITRGNYTSYTMPIESLDDDPSTFYNLTIEERGNDGTSMFVTQYTNFSSSHEPNLTSKSSSSVASIQTARIDDLTDPLGKEDFGNENGGSNGGTGGGGGSTTYPTDCDGFVLTTTVVVDTDCGCGDSVEDFLAGRCKGCNIRAPKWPSREEVTVYECDPIPSGTNGSTTEGNSGNGSTSGSNNSSDSSLTSPTGDDCKSLESALNSSYSAKSPFEFVDLSSFYPTGCHIDVENLEDNEKFMCIYNKLTKSTGFKSLFVNMFGVHRNINAKFELVDKFDSGAIAITDSHAVTSATTGEIVKLNSVIKISKEKLNSTSALGIAVVLIHEAVHAYLQVKHLECNAGVPTQQILEGINNKSLSDLFEVYFDPTCNSEEEHEFMFDFMTPVISNILQEVADDFLSEDDENLTKSLTFVNEENPDGKKVKWEWDTFYNHMSLIGLSRTDAFKQEFPKGSVQEKNYEAYLATGVFRFEKDCTE